VLAFIASFVFGLDHGTKAPPPSATPQARPAPVAVPDSRVRIEVLNGSRKAGLARLATDRLRAAGYDVVFLGNARSVASESVVLDRVGKREIANEVANILQIERIETQRDTARYLEVTVILGTDWRGHQPSTTNN
jgi:hypothetical protein